MENNVPALCLSLFGPSEIQVHPPDLPEALEQATYQQYGEAHDLDDGGKDAHAQE